MPIPLGTYLPVYVCFEFFLLLSSCGSFLKKRVFVAPIIAWEKPTGQEFPAFTAASMACGGETTSFDLKSSLHFVRAELIGGVSAAQERRRNTGIVFFKDRAFAFSDEIDGADFLTGDFLPKHFEKLVRVSFAFKGYIIAAVVF